MIKKEDFESVHAVSSDFYYAVENIQSEFEGLIGIFCVLENNLADGYLTEDLLKQAYYGMRVSFNSASDRLRSLIEETKIFPCVMVKEAK